MTVQGSGGKEVKTHKHKEDETMATAGVVKKVKKARPNGNGKASPKPRCDRDEAGEAVLLRDCGDGCFWNAS